MRRAALVAGTAVAVVLGASFLAPGRPGPGDCALHMKFLDIRLGCSVTENASSRSIVVLKTWCWPGDEEHAKRYRPCSQTLSLAPGQRTPAQEDWDGFRAEHDCVTKYDIHKKYYWWFPSRRTQDRRGLGDQWVKVSDDESAIVTSVECAEPP
jgi:hypothetical protein